VNPRIEELRQRLDREPGSRLFAQLAEELRKDGDVVGAIKVCRDGLSKHPAYPSAHITLGRALLDGGDFAGARSEFETVLKGAPDNILASRFLGEALENLGDLTGAIDRFKATLAMAPGDRALASRVEGLENRLRQTHLVKPIPVSAAEDSFEIEGQDLQAATLVPTSPHLEPAEPQSRIALGAAEEPSPAFSEPVTLAGATIPPTVFPAPQPLHTEAIFEFDGAVEAVGHAEPAIAIEPDSIAAPDSPLGSEANLSTPTLAELYFNQGFADKAVEVYRELLAREPGNTRAAARVAEIEALERPFGEGAGPAPIAADAPPLTRVEGPAVAAPSVIAPQVSPSQPLMDPRALRRLAIERTIARLEQLRLSLRRA
jgi:tetratricopeptide (TPR) repeat protein